MFFFFSIKISLSWSKYKQGWALLPAVGGNGQSFFDPLAFDSPFPLLFREGKVKCHFCLSCFLPVAFCEGKGLKFIWWHQVESLLCYCTCKLTKYPRFFFILAPLLSLPQSFLVILSWADQGFPLPYFHSGWCVPALPSLQHIHLLPFISAVGLQQNSGKSGWRESQQYPLVLFWKSIWHHAISVSLSFASECLHIF